MKLSARSPSQVRDRVVSSWSSTFGMQERGRGLQVVAYRVAANKQGYIGIRHRFQTKHCLLRFLYIPKTVSSAQGRVQGTQSPRV